MHLFAIAMTGPYARNEENEAARFCDSDGDATSVHRDSLEAVRAREHIDNVNSAQKGGVAAARASLFALARPCACDGKDETVPFRKRDGSTKSVLWDSSEAGRVDNHGGKIARVRNGHAKTTGASVSNSVTTIENLRALAKAKVAIDPYALIDAMVRSPRPPLFAIVSPLVEIFQL